MTMPTARPPSASSPRLAESVNEAWSAVAAVARDAAAVLLDEALARGAGG
jgi:hypothetical protein